MPTPKKSKASTPPTKAPTVTPPVLAAAAPPTQGAPSPPKGWKEPAKEKGKMGPGGAVPTSQQVRDAVDVAKELSAPTYADDFGKFAPSQGLITGALTRAKAWSDEKVATERWLAYVSTQTDAGWKQALGVTTDFQKQYDDAVKADGDIKKTYSQTGAFLNVHKVSAAKAVKTKAAKKKGTGGDPKK